MLCDKFNRMARFIDTIVQCQKGCRESGDYDRFAERPKIRDLFLTHQEDMLMDYEVHSSRYHVPGDIDGGHTDATLSYSASRPRIRGQPQVWWSSCGCPRLEPQGRCYLSQDSQLHVDVKVTSYSLVAPSLSIYLAFLHPHISINSTLLVDFCITLVVAVCYAEYDQLYARTLYDTLGSSARAPQSIVFPSNQALVPVANFVLA